MRVGKKSGLGEFPGQVTKKNHPYEKGADSVCPAITPLVLRAKVTFLF